MIFRQAVYLTSIGISKEQASFMDCSDFTSSLHLTVLGIIIGRTTEAQMKR